MTMIVRGPKQGLLLHTNIPVGVGVIARIAELRRKFYAETEREPHTMRIGPELERDLKDELSWLRLQKGASVDGALVQFHSMAVIVDPERAPRGIVLEASR